MDFMLYGMDAMVNQAAKWSSMLGGEGRPCVTFRSIINRGGDQGAQHSQALHSWFAHIPGLRVVMPSSPLDARDLLISSVLCDDPVLYIDDRWLYSEEEEYQPIKERPLHNEAPKVVSNGQHLTLVGSGYATKVCKAISSELQAENISCEIVDISVLNPLDIEPVLKSVQKTGMLYALDGGWKNCGFSAEIIAAVCEKINPARLKKSPKRYTIMDAPAPSSFPLEKEYYLNEKKIINDILVDIKQ
jgi:pyruvate dehydrogenase E1 component beta subunit